MAKYSKRAGEKVERAMHERKEGTLRSGSGAKVKSKKQAIAIGLSEARRAGVKLGTPKKGQTSPATRKKAQRDTAVGRGAAQPSPSRSRGAKKAARTRAKKYSRRA